MNIKLRPFMNGIYCGSAFMPLAFVLPKNTTSMLLFSVKANSITSSVYVITESHLISVSLESKQPCEYIS